MHVASDRQRCTEMRFPVQRVVRPDHDFRGYAGQVASGVGEAGRRSDGAAVRPDVARQDDRHVSTASCDEAFAPMSVTLTPRRRDRHQPRRHAGSAVARCRSVARISKRRWCGWTSGRSTSRRQYLIKHTTQLVTRAVRAIRYRVNMNTLEKHEAAELRLNEIGAVVIDTSLPLFFDHYRRNRATGTFILIDPISNATVAAGMITGRDPKAGDEPATLSGGGLISDEQRQARIGHPAIVIWLAAAAEQAYALEADLFAQGYLTHVVAGHSDRRIMLELVQNSVGAGLLTIIAAETLHASDRDRVRSLVRAEQFIDAGADQTADAVLGQLKERGLKS